MSDGLHEGGEVFLGVPRPHPLFGPELSVLLLDFAVVFLVGLVEDADELLVDGLADFVGFV